MNMALQTREETFTKSVALSSLNITGDLTLRKQKAWHILLYCVREQFFLKTKFDPSNAHEISKEDVQRGPLEFQIKDDLIMEAMGYLKGNGFYSYSTIVKIYRSLTKEVVGVDAFGFAAAGAHFAVCDTRERATDHGGHAAVATVVGLVGRAAAYAWRRGASHSP